MNTFVSKPITATPPPAPQPQNRRWLLFLIAFGGILYLAKEVVEHWQELDFLEVGPSGEAQPAKKDLERLAKELEEFDNCEQYVLLAGRDGKYHCYNCPGIDSIYLYTGEVWKYGYTCKGEKGRYPAGPEDPRLLYFKQFSGTLGECAKQEKTKIFYYPTLPENLKRLRPLKRPPGNKIRR